jgi:hypothetical protein
MARIEIIRVEKQMGNQVEITVQFRSPSASAQYDVLVEDQGNSGQNERAALKAVLSVARDTESTLRLRLGLSPR